MRLASEDNNSSQKTSTVDSVEKRFTAASAEKSEILITPGEQTSKDDAIPSKAVTSSVNDRLHRVRMRVLQTRRMRSRSRIERTERERAERRSLR